MFYATPCFAFRVSCFAFQASAQNKSAGSSQEPADSKIHLNPPISPYFFFSPPAAAAPPPPLLPPAGAPSFPINPCRWCCQINPSSAIDVTNNGINTGFVFNELPTSCAHGVYLINNAALPS